MRVKICGTGVDTYSFDEVVTLTVERTVAKSEPAYIVTPNAHHLVMLQKNHRFQEIYDNAFLAVPDGVPLLWAARLLKTPLQGRVNGTDLFERLCEVSAEKGLRVFFLGGRSGAAEQAAQVLKSNYPALKIAGTYCPPYGFESDKAELSKIASLIQTAAPDILFVGLGAPKQEYWIHDHYQQLNVPISIGIGVSFEFVANMVKRAPKFMQEMGLEWLFRLIMEPKRLWQRYLIGNLIFIKLVIEQKLISITHPTPLSTSATTSEN